MESKLKTLQRISKLKSIQSKKLFTYELTHLYDNEYTPVNFSTHIAPSVMSPLLTYIEFKSEEIDESWSISNDSIVKVIDTFYSKVNYEDGEGTIHWYDQYYNRERWCGTGLDSYETFAHPDLLGLLTELVNEEKARSAA